MNRKVTAVILIFYCLFMIPSLFNIQQALAQTSDGDASGLVGSWVFDQGNGTFVNSTVGNNLGIIEGGATWTEAENRTALHLDGQSRVIVQEDGSFNSSAITIEAFVNFDRLAYGSGVDSNNEQYIVSKGDNEAAGAYYLSQYGINDKELGFRFTINCNMGIFIFHNWTVSTPLSMLEKQTWYQIVGTFDRKTLSIYVNGALQNSISLDSTANIGNSEPLYFGSNGNSTISHYLSGSIREISIYNKALTAEEVQILYKVAQPKTISEALQQAAVTTGLYGAIVALTYSLSPDPVTNLGSAVTQAGGMNSPLVAIPKKVLEKVYEKIIKKISDFLTAKVNMRFSFSIPEGVVIFVSIVVTGLILWHTKSQDATIASTSLWLSIFAAFAVACITQTSSMAIDWLCAKINHIKKKITLWIPGLFMFAISGYYGNPFSSITSTEYFGKVKIETQALMAMTKILSILVLTLPFGIMTTLNNDLIVKVGTIGLSFVLITTNSQLMPVSPMAGKSISAFNKKVSRTALSVMMGVLLIFTMDVIPKIYYTGIGIGALALLGTLIYYQKKNPEISK